MFAVHKPVKISFRVTGLKSFNTILHSRYHMIYSCVFFFFSFIFAGGRVPPKGENGLFSGPSGCPDGARHIFFPKNFIPDFVSTSVDFVTPSLIGTLGGVT